VWVKSPDGTAYPCDVLRDPDGDRGDCAFWLAVPREPVQVGDPAGWRFGCAVLPPRSILGFSFTVPPWLAEDS
jgi:hypothetical protein